MFNEHTPPNEFKCPITLDLMQDPVIAADGHTYERAAIEEWFNLGHVISPKTSKELAHRHLIQNHGLRSLINDYRHTAKTNTAALHDLKTQLAAREKALEHQLQLSRQKIGKLQHQQEKLSYELFSQGKQEAPEPVKAVGMFGIQPDSYTQVEPHFEPNTFTQLQQLTQNEVQVTQLRRHIAANRIKRLIGSLGLRQFVRLTPLVKRATDLKHQHAEQLNQKDYEVQQVQARIAKASSEHDWDALPTLAQQAKVKKEEQTQLTKTHSQTLLQLQSRQQAKAKTLTRKSARQARFTAAIRQESEQLENLLTTQATISEELVTCYQTRQAAHAKKPLPPKRTPEEQLALNQRLQMAVCKGNLDAMQQAYDEGAELTQINPSLFQIAVANLQDKSLIKLCELWQTDETVIAQQIPISSVYTPEEQTLVQSIETVTKKLNQITEQDWTWGNLMDHIASMAPDADRITALQPYPQCRKAIVDETKREDWSTGENARIIIERDGYDITLYAINKKDIEKWEKEGEKLPRSTMHRREVGMHDAAYHTRSTRGFGIIQKQTDHEIDAFPYRVNGVRDMSCCPRPRSLTYALRKKGWFSMAVQHNRPRVFPTPSRPGANGDDVWTMLVSATAGSSDAQGYWTTQGLSFVTKYTQEVQPQLDKASESVQRDVQRAEGPGR